MKRREVLEWLSLTPAYLPFWMASGALIAMYLIRHYVFDIVLASIALLAAMIGIVFASRPDPELSQRTAKARSWSVVFFLLLVMAAVAFHFLRWVELENRWNKTFEQPTKKK